MFVSVQGIYRGGRIELIEQPKNISDETRVIVTFLGAGPNDLRSRGIGEEHARELRERLQTFTDDWSSPEMSIYDNYAIRRAFLRHGR